MNLNDMSFEELLISYFENDVEKTKLLLGDLVDKTLKKGEIYELVKEDHLDYVTHPYNWHENSLIISDKELYFSYTINLFRKFWFDSIDAHDYLLLYEKCLRQYFKEDTNFSIDIEIFEEDLSYVYSDVTIIYNESNNYVELIEKMINFERKFNTVYNDLNYKIKELLYATNI